MTNPNGYPSDWLPTNQRPDPVLDEESERIQRRVDHAIGVQRANAIRSGPSDADHTQYPSTWNPRKKDRP